MKCSICGTNNREDVDFCRHCGVSIARNAAASAAPAVTTEICPQCHRSHTSPARFCDQCGAKLAVRFDHPPIARRHPEPQAGPAASGMERPESPEHLAAARQFATSVAATPPRSAGAVELHARRDALAAQPQRGLKQQVMHRLGFGKVDAHHARRRLQLIAGLGAAVAGIILSGYLMAQTILVGMPPWQEPVTPGVPESVLLAAAAMEQEWKASLPASELPHSKKAPPEENGMAAADTSSEPAPSSGDSGVPDEADEALAKAGEQAGDLGQAPAASAASSAATLPRARAPDHKIPSVQENTYRVEGITAQPRPAEVRPAASSAERSERRPARLAASSQGWYASMKEQLSQCATDPNLFTRVVCMEKAKFRHCSPNRWGQVAECVKTQYRDGTSMHDLGGSLHGEPFRSNPYG